MGEVQQGEEQQRNTRQSGNMGDRLVQLTPPGSYGFTVASEAAAIAATSNGTRFSRQ
jgi:hypothetical protein